MGVARRGFLAGSASVLLASGGAAAAQGRRPDIADGMAGTWFGDVISDSQGSARSGVVLTITRVGPNTVQITSNDQGLPPVTIPLQKAMAATVNRNGDSAFAYNNGKLDVSFHNQVSWSGHRADLADEMSGTWFGDVISDSQGSGRTGVTLTLTRVAPNTVRITSDYRRLPVIDIEIERAMTAIVNRAGDSPLAFNKGHLDVSFHNLVSWSGQKTGY